MNSKFNKNDFTPLFSFTSGKAKLYEKRDGIDRLPVWEELGVGVVIMSTKVCNGQRNYSVYFELSNEKVPIGAVTLSPHNEMINMPMIVNQDEECRTWNIIHFINEMQSVSRSFTFFNSQHGEKFQEMLKRFQNKMHEFRSSINNNNGLMPNQMMSPGPCYNNNGNNMNNMNMNGNYFMDNNKKYLPRRNQNKKNGQNNHFHHQNNMNMNHNNNNNNFEDMSMTMPMPSTPFFSESPLLPPLNKNPLPFQSPYFQCENNINNNNKMFKMKGQNQNKHGNKNNNNNGSMWNSSTNDLREFREPFSSANGQDYFGNGSFFSPPPNSDTTTNMNNNTNENSIFSTTIKNNKEPHDYVPFFDQQQLQYQQQLHPSMFVGIEEEVSGNRIRPLSTHSSYSSSGSASASSYPFFQDMDALKSPGAPINMNINNAMNDNNNDDSNTPLSSGIFNFNMDFLCGSDDVNTYSPFTSPMISNLDNINGNNKDMDLTIQGVSPDPSGDDDEAKSPNLQSRFFPHIKINGENNTTTTTSSTGSTIMNNTSTNNNNNNNNSYGGKKFTLPSLSSEDEVDVHKKPLRSTYNSNGYGHKDFGHFRSNNNNNHNNNNKNNNKSSSGFDSSGTNNFDPFTSTTTSTGPMSAFPNTTTTSIINNQQDNYHNNYFGSSTASTSNSNFTPPNEYKPKEEETSIPFKAEFVHGADWDSDLADTNLLLDSVCDMYVKVLAETDGESTNLKLGNDTSEHLGEGNLQIYLIRDRRLAWVVFRQGEGSSGILFQTPIFFDLVLTSYKAVSEKKQITWNGVVVEVKNQSSEENKEKEKETKGDGQEILKSKNMVLKRFAAIFPKTRIYTSAALSFIESFCAASKAKISLEKFVELMEMPNGLSTVAQLLKINSENSS